MKTKSILSVLFMLLLVTGLSSCSMDDEKAELEREKAELEQQLQDLQEDSDESREETADEDEDENEDEESETDEEGKNVQDIITDALEDSEQLMVQGNNLVTENGKLVMRITDYVIDDDGNLVDENDTIIVRAMHLKSDESEDIDDEKDTNAQFDGTWAGIAYSENMCGGAVVKFIVEDDDMDGIGVNMDENKFLVEGAVDEDGTISAGMVVGSQDLASFEGNITGNMAQGTWADVYGCSGTFYAGKGMTHEKIVATYAELSTLANSIESYADMLESDAEDWDDWADDVEDWADDMEDWADDIDDWTDDLDDVF